MENKEAEMAPLQIGVGNKDPYLIFAVDDGNREMLRISREGFWVRGQKVPDADAPRVVEAFKSWLWKVNCGWSGPPQEEGWLIEDAIHTAQCLCVGENPGPGQSWYWTGPDKAVRFSRDLDAWAMARILGLNANEIRVVCHEWETTDISR